jgi:uncharacterized RDD family membrane protein YckC
MSDVQRDPTATGGPPGQAPAVPAREIQAASGPSGPRAGFWQRVGAQILDVLILAVPSIILVLLLDQVVGQILSTVLSLAYFAYFEGGPTGQTIGKRVLGIRVIDIRAGGPIGYGRAVVRWLVESIFSWIFLLGYLWMLWDREKQTWQDKAASSVVVPVDAYPIQAA